MDPESLPLEQWCVREKRSLRLCRKMGGRPGCRSWLCSPEIERCSPALAVLPSCPCRWSFLGYPVPATLSESEVSCVFPLASSITLQTKILLTTGQMLAEPPPSCLAHGPCSVAGLRDPDCQRRRHSLPGAPPPGAPNREITYFQASKMSTPIKISFFIIKELQKAKTADRLLICGSF